MFFDETFHPEIASTKMTYRSFHQGRDLTAIELDFLFCSEALKFVDLSLNFYNFACILKNATEQSSTYLFTSFTS